MVWARRELPSLLPSPCARIDPHINYVLGRRLRYLLAALRKQGCERQRHAHSAQERFARMLESGSSGGRTVKSETAATAKRPFSRSRISPSAISPSWHRRILARHQRSANVDLHQEGRVSKLGARNEGTIAKSPGTGKIQCINNLLWRDFTTIFVGDHRSRRSCGS